MNIDLDFSLMIPELLIIGVALLVLLMDAFAGDVEGDANGGPRGLITGIGVLGCIAAAFVVAIKLWPAVADGGISSFGGLFVVDHLALFFQVLVLMATAMGLLLSDTWLRHHRMGAGAFCALLLFAASGMLYMLSAGDFVMLFLGLEVMSIPIYCLAAAERWDDRSVEAGVKYLVLGSFATAIMLFGLALLYGFVGIESGVASTRIVDLQAAVASATSIPAWAMLGGLMTLVGLLFKVSAAPFHMWTPDVYEGAPTSITAYMSVAVKATTIAVLLRIFGGPMLESLQLTGILAGVAVLTMIVGNFMALVQSNVKRMLAYSSIAHGGYMLVGLLSGSVEGQAGILYYALAYTVTNFAAFGVLVYLSREGHDVETFDDLKGLGAAYPLLGVVMVVAMLSLMGIPPFAGFFGKFMLFRAAIAEGWIFVAVIGLLTSAVSVGYYLRPIVAMFMSEHAGEIPAPGGRTLPVSLTLGVATFLVVALGVLPDRYLELAVRTVWGLGG